MVPKSKRMYILYDVNREASALRIPFGKVADPLGRGVERCYALYEYAKKNQFKGTDDSSILEYSNIFPKLKIGDVQNTKITTQFDLELSKTRLK